MANEMKWSKGHPNEAGYYWVIRKNKELHLCTIAENFDGTLIVDTSSVIDIDSVEDIIYYVRITHPPLDELGDVWTPTGKAYHGKSKAYVKEWPHKS